MRRRAPQADSSTEVPEWVHRFRPELVEQYVGPDDGPDDEFRELHHPDTVATDWEWHRYCEARRAWRAASRAWWIENAPTHPRAPWDIRRDARSGL